MTDTRTPTWASLLLPTGPDADARVVAPWIGRNDVWDARRRWIVTERPPRWGWYSFSIRSAKLVNPEPVEAPWPQTWFASAAPASPATRGQRGQPALLVGDTAWLYTSPYTRLHVPLPPPDTAQVSRVRVLIHKDRAAYVLETLFDAPAEVAVRQALLEERDDIDHVQGATPAHRAMFDALTQHRKDRAKRRQEAEAARAREALYRQEGTAQGRRRVAAVEPERGARLALEAGGGRLAGFRALAADRALVDWTLDGQPFQCVVTLPDLALLDAGVCLAGADRVLTLEALPPVCREARETRRLVVLRHVGEDDGDDWSDG